MLAAAQWAVASVARLPGFTDSQGADEPGAKAVNVIGHLAHGMGTALTAAELYGAAKHRIHGTPGERVG